MHALGRATIVLRREAAGVWVVVSNRPSAAQRMGLDRVDEACGRTLAPPRAGDYVGSALASAASITPGRTAALGARHRVGGEDDRNPKSGALAFDDGGELPMVGPPHQVETLSELLDC